MGAGIITVPEADAHMMTGIIPGNCAILARPARAAWAPEGYLLTCDRYRPVVRELLDMKFQSSFMSEKPIYKVIFYNQSQVYEVYARAIYQSDMYGFIEVEEFVFGERSQMIVDPGEEKLKSEFANVSRSYIPMQAIIRIDEVEKEGAVKVTDIKSSDKIALFPFPGGVTSPKGSVD